MPTTKSLARWGILGSLSGGPQAEAMMMEQIVCLVIMGERYATPNNSHPGCQECRQSLLETDPHITLSAEVERAVQTSSSSDRDQSATIPNQNTLRGSRASLPFTRVGGPLRCVWKYLTPCSQPGEDPIEPFGIPHHLSGTPTGIRYLPVPFVRITQLGRCARSRPGNSIEFGINKYHHDDGTTHACRVQNGPGKHDTQPTTSPDYG